MKYRGRSLRHELKYIINSGTYEILRARAAGIMKPDAYAVPGSGEYRVTSLYFDDIYRTAYSDKLNGIHSRRKYRVRCYNLSPGRIVLEAKYKDGDLVSKKNALLTAEEYRKLIGGGYSMGYEEKFAETSMEDMAASNASAALCPSVVVDYFREAYVNKAGNVRLTFDKKLSTSFDTYDMLAGGVVFSPVLNGEIIMELKYDDFFPAHIEAVFSGLPLLRQPVSKFVLCLDKLKEIKPQGIIY